MSSTGTMTRLQRRSRVLDLYRRCLRSAKRCPRYEHAQQMRLYTRMKFKENASLKDTSLVQTLLFDGEKELETMDYYHTVREKKEKDQEQELQQAEGVAVSSVVPAPSSSSLSPPASSSLSHLSSDSGLLASSSSSSSSPIAITSTVKKARNSTKTKEVRSETAVAAASEATTPQHQQQQPSAVKSTPPTPRKRKVVPTPLPLPTTITTTTTTTPSSLPSTSSSSTSFIYPPLSSIPEEVLERASISLGQSLNFYQQQKQQKQKLSIASKNSASSSSTTSPSLLEEDYVTPRLQSASKSIDEAAAAIAEGYAQAHQALKTAHLHIQIASGGVVPMDMQMIRARMESSSKSTSGRKSTGAVDISSSLPPSATRNATVASLADVSLSIKQLLAHLDKYRRLEEVNSSTTTTSSSSPSSKDRGLLLRSSSSSSTTAAAPGSSSSNAGNTLK